MFRPPPPTTIPVHLADEGVVTDVLVAGRLVRLPDERGGQFNVDFVVRDHPAAKIIVAVLEERGMLGERGKVRSGRARDAEATQKINRKGIRRRKDGRKKEERI